MTPVQFKDARIALGLSQNAAAKVLGLASSRAIRHIESGERAVSDRVGKLMAALLMDDMIGWIESTEEPDLQQRQVVMIKTRDGKEFGPIPFGLTASCAWDGCASHYSHDIVAYRLVI